MTKTVINDKGEEVTESVWEEAGEAEAPGSVAPSPNKPAGADSFLTSGRRILWG